MHTHFNAQLVTRLCRRDREQLTWNLNIDEPLMLVERVRHNGHSTDSTIAGPFPQVTGTIRTMRTEVGGPKGSTAVRVDGAMGVHPEDGSPAETRIRIQCREGGVKLTNADLAMPGPRGPNGGGNTVCVPCGPD